MSRYRRHLGPILVLAAGLLAAAGVPAEQLRDPMRPPKAQTSGSATATATRAVTTRYRLDSIIIAPNRRQAIINGKSVALGETIGRAKLIAIEATQVTLLVAGKRRVITLLPLSIKMPSEATVP